MGVDKMTDFNKWEGGVGVSGLNTLVFIWFQAIIFLLVRVGSTGEGVDVLDRDEGVPDRDEGS